MCSPSAPATPSTQTSTTDLPDWAKPYAKTALSQGAALTNIDTNPYQTYGGDRIAGFQPMQQQSFQSAENMKPAEQIGAATGLASVAGLGGLDANYRTGRFSGGQFGSDQAQQYMSPYIEQAMQPQLREAQRASDIAGTQQNAQAVQAGAFGGSRSAIANAERERNLGMQQGDIRAKGYQTAYEQAANQYNQDASRGLQAQQLGEQSRQYGAGLGMQGLQTALSAAGQLGQLGQNQYGQEMGITQMQNQMGTQQQQQAQRPLDTAYQDFLNQQNYPYKQLGFMSDLIHGLPLGQKSTSQVYEAPGSTLGQLAGLGVGLGGMANFGSKVMAEGGLAYAGGGDVTSPQNIEAILAKLSDAQLQQAHEAALNRRDLNEAQMIEAVMAQRAAMRQGSEQPHGGIAPALPEQFANDMEQSMATGGIVAFADRGIVTEGEDYSHEGLSSLAPVSTKPTASPAPVATKTKPSAKQPAVPDSIKPAVAALAEKTGTDTEDLMARVPGLMDMFQKQNAPLLEQQRAMVEQSKPDNEAMRQQGIAQAMMQFGFKMAANASRPNARFLESASAAAPEISAAAQDMNKLMAAKQENYNKLKMDQMKYENALQIGNMKDATILSGQIRQSQQTDKQIKMQQDQLAATIQHQTEMESQGRKGLDIQAAQAANAAANRPETIKSISDMLANATPEQRKNIENAAGLRYGVAANVRSNTALLQAQEKAREAVDKLPRFMNLSFMSTTDPKYPALKAEYDQEVRSRVQQLMPQGSDVDSTASTASPGAGTIMQFDAKGNPI